MTSLLLILGGFALLLLGGELMVRNAVAAATALGVSRLFIGLVLVGFGTSTPELVTSVQAALAGSPGIAVGNVVGSNICNVLLILGLTATLAPFIARPGVYARDLVAVLLTSLMGLGVLFMGEIGRLTGLVFLAVLAAYVWLAYTSERGTAPERAVLKYVEDRRRVAAAVSWRSLSGPLLLAALGVLLTVVGADCLVEGAIDLAKGLGLSETVIGLTIVAVGTSLPELVTSLIAARRGAPEVALGNVLGSNIFNLIGILGVTALITPVQVPPEVLRLDVWAMLLSSLAMIAIVVAFGRFTRWHGQTLLAAYTAYVAALLVI